MDLPDHLVPVSARTHPELHAAVGDLARKAGLHPPRLILLDPKKLNPQSPLEFFERFTLAKTFHLSDGTHAILLNPHTLHIFGMKSFRGPATDELRSVIAHELGHVVRGESNIFGANNLARHSPLVCTLGAIGLMGLLQHQWAKAKEKGMSSEQATYDALEQMKAQKPPQDSPTLAGMLTAAQLLLAGVVGASAGFALRTHIRYNKEFACDAFSKKLMGTGQPLANVFRNMQAWEKEIFAEIKANKQLSAGQLDILRLISFLHGPTHPPDIARIARLER